MTKKEILNHIRQLKKSCKTFNLTRHMTDHDKSDFGARSVKIIHHYPSVFIYHTKDNSTAIFVKIRSENCQTGLTESYGLELWDVGEFLNGSTFSDRLKNRVRKYFKKVS